MIRNERRQRFKENNNIIHGRRRRGDVDLTAPPFIYIPFVSFFFFFMILTQSPLLAVTFPTSLFYLSSVRRLINVSTCLYVIRDLYLPSLA